MEIVSTLLGVVASAFCFMMLYIGGKQVHKDFKTFVSGEPTNRGVDWGGVILYVLALIWWKWFI